MTDYERLILDLVRQLNGSKKRRQVTDILQGNKTSQNMIDIYLHRILPFFGVLENEHFMTLKTIIQQLLETGALIEREDGRLQLTDKGLSAVSDFTLQTNYRHLNGWRWHRRLPLFAMALQLTAQMTANAHQEIAHYFPIVRDTSVQVYCKQWWLKAASGDKTALAKHYHDELMSLLETIEIAPNVIVDRLTGGPIIGLTAEQSAQKQHVPTERCNLQWLAGLSEMMDLLERYPKSWPLLAQLLPSRALQLTESAQQTHQLLLSGVPVREIEPRRRLQQSTIVDHFVQLIGLQILPLERFVSAANITYFNLNQQRATSLKDARDFVPALGYDTLKLCLVSEGGHHA